MSECDRKTCKLSGDSIPELGDGEPSPPPATEQFPMPTLADVLCNASQLLNTVKADWQRDGCWSEWDEATCEGIRREQRKLLRSGAAQEVSPLTPYGELMQRVDDYRSGYSCGYSDAKNGTRMRDKDAAQLFFRIDDGIPDVSEYQLNQEEVSPPSPDKFKSALELIENYDSSCECDDHSQPECCANVSVSDCFCAHCIAGKALL